MKQLFFWYVEDIHSQFEQAKDNIHCSGICWYDHMHNKTLECPPAINLDKDFHTSAPTDEKDLRKDVCTSSEPCICSCIVAQELSKNNF